MTTFIIKYGWIPALLLALTACDPKTDKDEVLHGYNLQAPQKFFMPESLFEISGITFKDGLSDTIYAVQDEEGKLFRLAYGVKKQEHTRFGKKADYEDLAIIKNQVVILKSSGALLTFPLSDASGPEVDSVTEWKKLLPKGEYEAIYGGTKNEKLYVICKNCKQDDAKVRVSGFIFQVTDSISQAGDFEIDVQQIIAKTGKMKAAFRPSGIARNPLTNDWYIIAAINKLLVVTDSSWQVKETAHLDANMFNQPEGIAFDKAGNLYISNEGGDLSDGNILNFKRLSE